MTRRAGRERPKDGPENRPKSFGADAVKAAFAVGWPTSGKPDIGRWSAGRRSGSVARLRKPWITARARLGTGLASPSLQGALASGVTHRRHRGAVAQRPGA